MFRRERPQKGRYRQFYQIGAEAIGSESPVVDAEVIEMVVAILHERGLDGLEAADQFSRLTRIAGRCSTKLLREQLERRAPTHVRRLPAPCRNQPAACARLQGAGRSAHHRLAALHPRLSLTSRAATHFRRSAGSFLTTAKSIYEVRPRLVRGLDYYMRTTFEITHGALGAQNSILGGGRYDGLAGNVGIERACARHWFFHR